MQMRLCCFTWTTAVVLIGLFAGGWAQAREQKTLLGAARKVADLSAWQQGNGTLLWNRAGNDYNWLDAHQLLLFRFSGIKQRKENWRLSTRDALTGKETVLPLLSKRFVESGGIHGWHSISPDGQWLLWFGRRGYYVAKLNGSHFMVRPESHESTFVGLDWLGDSRHWVEWITNRDGVTKAFLRHSTSNYEQKRIQLSSADWLRARSGSPYRSPLIAWDNHLVVTTGAYFDSYPQCHVIKAPIGGRGNTETYAIKAPAGWLFERGGEVSRSGKQIVWSCKLRSGGADVRSLWVSNIDGSRLHMVGTMKGDLKDSFTREQWVPGDGWLSFEYHNALYVVPA